MPKIDQSDIKKILCCNKAKYHLGVWDEIYDLLSDDMKQMLNEEWDKAIAIAGEAEERALGSLEK